MISNANSHILILAAGSSRRLARLTRERPKALLEVEGKSIICRSLDFLSTRGFKRLTMVTGYKGHLFRSALGSHYNDIAIDYVVSEEYATTEHGWSLFLTRDSWLRTRAPVLFMDADNFYDPALIDRLLASRHENVILIDRSLNAEDREEELVSGVDGRVRGLSRGKSRDVAQCVGGFVGMNRFSASFMGSLYDFMVAFYEQHDRQYKYERILHRFTQQTDHEVHYTDSVGLSWININHENDLKIAEEIARGT